MCRSTHINQKRRIYLCVLPLRAPLCSGSFEPLTPEPQVAEELAKGTKEKTQTQSGEEYGEREDENRRQAAPFISSNRSPCCTT